MMKALSARLIHGVVWIHIWGASGCTLSQAPIPEKNPPPIPVTAAQPARIAEPPEADQPSESRSKGKKYYVHTIKWPAERLILIARWYTGTGNNWPRLLEANPSLDPKRIKIGDSILIPEDLLKTRTPMPESYLSRTADKRKQPPPPAAESPAPTDGVELFGPIDSETQTEAPDEPGSTPPLETIE